MRPPWGSGSRLAATCTIPPPDAWDGPALTAARHAQRAALTAAVRHAAAAEALRVIEDEAAATRYRFRAVKDRWIPRLEQALAEVTFAIEEQERADAARLRLATSTLTGPAAARPARAGAYGGNLPASLWRDERPGKGPPPPLPGAAPP